MIDLVSSAKSGELGAIGCDALCADRARGRRKIELREAGRNIGRIVDARKALRSPYLLQAFVHRIGREGRRTDRSPRKLDGVLMAREVGIVILTAAHDVKERQGRTAHRR